MGASSKTKWEEFLRTYYAPEIDDLLVHFPEKKSLYVRFDDVHWFDDELADELLTQPDPVLNDATAALGEFGLGNKTLTGAHVRIIGLPKSAHLMVKALSAPLLV